MNVANCQRSDDTPQVWHVSLTAGPETSYPWLAELVETFLSASLAHLAPVLSVAILPKWQLEMDFAYTAKLKSLQLMHSRISRFFSWSDACEVGAIHFLELTMLEQLHMVRWWPDSWGLEYDDIVSGGEDIRNNFAFNSTIHAVTLHLRVPSNKIFLCYQCPRWLAFDGCLVWCSNEGSSHCVWTDRPVVTISQQPL